MARIRNVWDTDMVAHLWANQSQESARNVCGNFYFAGDTIYSYGSHFPIARFAEHRGKKCVLMTTRTYSTTTSRHIQLARGASRNHTTFYVPDVMELNHKANLKHFAAKIIEDAKKAKRARLHKGYLLSDLEAYVGKCNQYAEFFGLKTRFTMPTDLDLAAEREKAKAAAAIEDRRKQRKLEEDLKKATELLDQWKLGDSVATYTLWPLQDTYLRVKDDVLETSRGAEVPLKHAIRILPLIRSGQPYQRNGHTEHVGHFALDSIDAEGNVSIGCHFVKRAEIERIAAQLGV